MWKTIMEKNYMFCFVLFLKKSHAHIGAFFE